MIEELVNVNQLRLRDILTLTPEIISWLDVMAKHEAAIYSALSDEQLAAACRAL